MFNLYNDFKKQMAPNISKLAHKTQSVLGNIKNQIEKKINTSLHSYEFIEIVPRIFYMSYPTPETIVQMSENLNKLYGSNYFIWSLAENPYEIKYFNKQVSENCVNGYPNPSLNHLFIICFSIISWVKNHKDHIAIIHCQSTKGRSALLLSCLGVLLKYFDDTSEALIHFCKLTNTSENTVLFPTQQLYLKYFSHLIHGFKIQSKNIKIIKIMFSDIPKIRIKNEKDEYPFQDFRPYLQIFKDSKILFNSLEQNQIPSYIPTDLSIWFETNVLIKDDILIRCKHYETNEKRHPVFRIMLNTGFCFDNVVRIFKRDIDLAANIIVEDNFFIDIIFKIEENLNEHEDETEKITENVKKLIEDKDYSFIIDECNKKLTEKKEKSSELSKELEKILSSRTQNLKISDQKNFSISEDISPTSENKHEEDEILQEIIKKQNEKPNEESKSPERKLKLMEKIIGNDDEEINDNETDDYISKLENQE